MNILTNVINSYLCILTWWMKCCKCGFVRNICRDRCVYLPLFISYEHLTLLRILYLTPHHNCLAICIWYEKIEMIAFQFAFMITVRWSCASREVREPRQRPMRESKADSISCTIHTCATSVERVGVTSQLACKGCSIGSISRMCA